MPGREPDEARVPQPVRVFARGMGPGPYNVGIKFDDGSRTVVTYRTYKHHYKRSLMSDKQYATVAGIVQFEPRTREANGKTVTDIAVRASGSQKLVNITVWPEYELVFPIQRGDGIMADGSFETRTYQDKQGATQESLQLNPTSLVVIPAVTKAERQVMQAPAASGEKAPF